MLRPCDLDERAQDPYITCPYCMAAPGKRCQGEDLSEIEAMAFRADLRRAGQEPLG